MRGRFWLIEPQVGTEHDPNGWTLHEYDIFIESTTGLKRAHEEVPDSIINLCPHVSST